ncbi:MAG: DUF4190 domain-containing protein [Actinomycetales bacterium]|nr:DUF4190 domain-containing protein [Actinomycetales bacterium]
MMTTERLPWESRYSRGAVIGFATALLGLVPISIPFSVGGLVQTGEGGQRGRGLAVAGLVVSALWLVPVVVWFALR